MNSISVLVWCKSLTGGSHGYSEQLLFSQTESRGMILDGVGAASLEKEARGL